MKIIDNLRDGCKILKNNNISSYKIDCEILMSQTLEISREELILNLEKEVDNEDRKKYFDFISRRKKNEPIAYITSNKNFWRDKFIIDKNVLIPRPDSEHLVEQTLKLIKKDQTKRIADAIGYVHMKKETLNTIIDKRIEKGDVFLIARIAGIMASKQTSSYT